MTKSKQSKTAPMDGQRYSGPELEDLLDRVVSELGPSAEITAVNKIRSGGVAGFFCREEYEIVVEPVGSGSAASSGRSEATIAAARAGDSANADRTGRSETTDPADERSETQRTAEAAGPIGDLDNVDGEGIAPGRPVADRTDGGTGSDAVGSEVAETDEVFGGPRPGALDGSDQRFLELLERRLAETSAAESDLAARRTRRPAPAPTPIEPTDARDRAETAAVAPPTVSTRRPEPPAQNGPTGPNRFWAEVSMAGHRLAAIMPASSTFVAVLGPLSLTTPVVRRLRSAAELASADVVVLTDRAEIVSEPNWQLVRSGHQLVEVANDRADWPTVLVVDVPVDLPQWVEPLQQRLRLAGVGTFRYAVPGDPSAQQLQQYRLRSDVPYVLDLVSRVDPGRVVELVEQQHPIGSVGGAPLTAELLVAMQEQVDLGR